MFKLLPTAAKHFFSLPLVLQQQVRSNVTRPLLLLLVFLGTFFWPIFFTLFNHLGGRFQLLLSMQVLTLLSRCTDLRASWLGLGEAAAMQTRRGREQIETVVKRLVDAFRVLLLSAVLLWLRWSVWGAVAVVYNILSALFWDPEVEKEIRDATCDDGSATAAGENYSRRKVQWTLRGVLNRFIRYISNCVTWLLFGVSPFDGGKTLRQIFSPTEDNTHNNSRRAAGTSSTHNAGGPSTSKAYGGTESTARFSVLDEGPVLRGLTNGAPRKGCLLSKPHTMTNV